MRMNEYLRALAGALMMCAVFANAAQVNSGSGILREAAAGNQTPVAIVELSSISAATGAFAAGFTGIGEPNPTEESNAVFSWLFMVPSLECADMNKPATVCLLTPENELDIVDRAAIIPLSAIGGGFRLRDSLQAVYRSIKGTNVLFCSDSVDSNRYADICMVITHETAFVANNRESLKWIARKYRDKTLPAPRKVRTGSNVSISFDGPSAAAIISKIIPEGVDLDGMLGYISLFGQTLRTAVSLDISLMPDVRSWRIACRLNYPEDMLGRIRSVPVPADALLKLIPPRSYCRSASDFPVFASLLPDGFRRSYGERTPQTPFGAFHILPFVPEGDPVLYPHLTGERVSAIVIDQFERRIGKIEIYPAKNPAELEEVLGKTISASEARSDGLVKSREKRLAGGTGVFGYYVDVVADADIDSSSDFAAKALTLMLGLHTVEAAVADGKLIVASGSPGFIESWLEKGRFSGQDDTVESLLTPFDSSPEGEEVLGGGEIQPSASLLAISKSIGNLHELDAKLPHSGGGLNWRISRCATGVVFEFAASNSEILSIMALKKLDTKDLSQFILNNAINVNESSDKGKVK